MPLSSFSKERGLGMPLSSRRLAASQGLMRPGTAMWLKKTSSSYAWVEDVNLLILVLVTFDSLTTWPKMYFSISSPDQYFKVT